MRKKQAANVQPSELLTRSEYEKRAAAPRGIAFAELWDNLRGVLIIVFAAGALLWSYYDYDYYIKTAVNIIFTFIAPAAAFAAGYLGNKGDRFVGIVKYLAAYLLTAVLLFAENWLLSGSMPSLLKPAGAVWFLLAAAVWRAIQPYGQKLKFAVFFSLCVSILIGFWSEVDSELALLQTVLYLPFFLAGGKLSSVAKPRKALPVALRIPLSLIMLAAGCAGVLALERYVGITADMLMRAPYDGYRVMIIRGVITVLAALFTLGLVLVLPRRKVFVLGALGKNWLAVFCAVCLVSTALPVLLPASGFSPTYYLLLAGVFVAVLLLFGNKLVSGGYLKLLQKLAGIFDLSRRKAAAVARGVLAVCMIALLAVPLAQKALEIVGGSSASSAYRPIAQLLPEDTITQDDICIAYVGDLILLQDQVYDAYDPQTGLYDYSDVFRYASEYLKAADLAVGVFEGTTAGEQAGYSTSNFYDTIEMHLSYPDSFARAVADSGIDLVTTANNHMLDKGLDGLARTKQVLAQSSITSVGSYTSETDKQNNAVVLVQVKGLTLAFVSFTYGANHHTEQQLQGELAYTGNYLAAPTSSYFQSSKQNAVALVEKAASSGADCVVVMAHMGEQFSLETSTYQDVWNDIFIGAGANLVLGDHSHTVQPIENRTVGDKTALVVNCPGNFANQYTDHNGDATALVEIYLNAENGSIKGCAVVPMYTLAPLGGQYTAVPIYTLLNDDTVFSQLSEQELSRIDEVHSLVTSVMLKTELQLDQLQPRYYLINGEYMRSPVPAPEYEGAQENELLKLIAQSNSVCFVGDSVTAGTANGGYGWFEPLAAMIPQVKVETAAWGSSTVKTLLSRSAEIAAHDCGVFVIAIGVNDVRYRNENCALTAEEFANCLEQLSGEILKKNPDAKIVIVSPWPSFADDPNTTMSAEKCREMQAQYGSAAAALCEQNGWLYLNALTELAYTLTHSPVDEHMIDFVHPNAAQGIQLYSLAVLHAAQPAAILPEIDTELPAA